MTSVFIAVLNMSISASIVALSAMLVRFPLKKAPKIFSYALWGIVLFRLVCPFSFESSFSFMPASTNAIPRDIVYSQNPTIHTGMDFIDAPVNEAINNALPPMRPENGNLLNDTYVNPVRPVNPANPESNTSPFYTVFDAAGYIWLSGFIVLLLYAAIGYMRLKKRVYFATLVRGNIYETDKVNTPFVLGFFQPKIYIPVGIDPAAQDYILMHEQTHIKRYDHIIKPLAFTVFALHWFNPLMWAAYFLMSRDIEMSCDEVVLKKSDEDIRGEYSTSLLNLSVKRGSLLLTPLAFGESGVRERVKNVLKFKNPSVIITVVALALVVVFTVGFAANRTSEGVTDLPDTEATPSVPVNFGDKNMTLDDLRALSSKGDGLLFEDLHEYNGVKFSTVSGRYINVYDVEGGYRLLVQSSSTGKPDAVYFESIWEYRGTGIDFRYEDIEEYLRNTPSREYVTEEQAWQLLTSLNDYLWGSNPPPAYDPQGTTHEPGEECWEFHINNADPDITYSPWIWAVGKSSGAIYAFYDGDEVAWFRYPNNLGVSRKPTMTLDDVHGLAAKGEAISEADLEPYYHPPVVTGIYAVRYPVNGGNYALRFTWCVENGLFLVQTGNSPGSIDIRYYDVDKFIADGTQELVRPLPE